ncbi:hypothetical protein GCM10022233_07970 [Streptomyces shaanxiensis]|uniref:Uncharacterized protein n=1 Tax=Streptomyces shaanxiensis TaxID=653357 RepID=A0ABP7UEP5_9ACTN
MPQPRKGGAGNPLGARGCIDMRLRRVGATCHNEPAPAEPPHPYGVMRFR